MAESPEIAFYPHPRLAGSLAFEGTIHLAIGMFDGVHLGHRVVMQQAIDAAGKQRDHASAVLTFNPHPSCVLYPERATRMLLDLETRIERIHHVGIDMVFVQTFTRQYAKNPAREFVPQLIEVFPRLTSIHVGENFRFGSGRSGDINLLRESAAENGIGLQTAERVVLDGMAISSSRIRAALQEGSIDRVNAMLGEPYVVHGCITSGKGVGRKLNFPTVNLPWSQQVSPRHGVYRVTLLHQETGCRYNGVANYGLRPTVETASDPILEVHLLDADTCPEPGDLVEVELLEFLRPEKDFGSVEALVSQVEQDVLDVRKRLSGQHSPS